jgi:hypothetical protein
MRSCGRKNVLLDKYKLNYESGQNDLDIILLSHILYIIDKMAQPTYDAQTTDDPVFR